MKPTQYAGADENTDKVFLSGRESKCSMCGERIDEGDRITLTGNTAACAQCRHREATESPICGSGGLRPYPACTYEPFVLVMAGINCIWIPYGLLLGIATFLALGSEEAKREYHGSN